MYYAYCVIAVHAVSFEEATGTIDYTLTNDYMFRAILQSNEKVLRGLIGALSYLCRAFDNLQKGEQYEQVLPAIHIGILDFILFPDDLEFYATNKLMNVRSHKVFNDKFVLNVLSLKQIELATDEDKLWELDKWAALFSAKKL